MYQNTTQVKQNERRPPKKKLLDQTGTEPVKVSALSDSSYFHESLDALYDFSRALHRRIVPRILDDRQLRIGYPGRQGGLICQ